MAETGDDLSASKEKETYAEDGDTTLKCINVTPEVKPLIPKIKSSIAQKRSIPSDVEDAANTSKGKKDVRYGNPITLKIEPSVAQKRPAPSDDVDAASMSKNQRKKLAKREFMMSIRKERRKDGHRRRVEKRRKMMELGEKLPPKKPLVFRMEDSPCDVNVVVDLSFDDFMTESEILKVIHQLQMCYSVNRRSPAPVKFHVTSLCGRSKETLFKINGTTKWDVFYHSADFSEVFAGAQTVFLTSESPNVLEDLEPGNAYIIGGLVDHNHHKGLCHRMAEEQGIEHARLPIDQFLDMKKSKVLTINHVFEILLRYTECGDWKEAMLKVIPERKGAAGKESESTASVPRDVCSDEKRTDGKTIKERSVTSSTSNCNQVMTTANPDPTLSKPNSSHATVIKS